MYKVTTKYRNGIIIHSFFDSLKEANAKAAELFSVDSKKATPEFYAIEVSKEG